MSEAITKQVINDLAFLKEKIIQIEIQISEINDDLHIVRPEYIKKLKKIDKGKFISRKELDKRLAS